MTSARILRPLAVALVSSLVLVACGSQDAPTADPETDTAAADESDSAEAYPRTVTHALGETTIPAPPERIVAITGTAELDPLILLDHRPIAAAVVDEELNDFSAHLEGRTDGIDKLGSRREIDLEAIVAREPDLILGTVGWLGEIQSQLDQIAPTVVVDDGESWQDVLRLVATTVAEEDAAEAHIAAVDARIDQLRTTHADVLEGTTYTLLHSFPNEATNYVYVNTDISDLLDDLGMRVSDQVAADTPEEDNYIGYSIERTEPLATDLILAYSYGDGDTEGSAAIASFLSAPINQNLPAVANDRVVPVNSGWWYLTSALGIERVLDEFERDVLPALEDR